MASSEGPAPVAGGSGPQRPPPLDARAAFNNSVSLRISSKRLIQTFTAQLGPKLYLTEEELAPSRPLIETFVKEVCSLTYDIVKDDRQRLGELQERYNTLVEANRRSQLGYMRELVALREKVRRPGAGKDEQNLNLSTSDYDVMFYDALQFLDQDAKELVATVTNERVRLILQAKKTSSDIHGTKHQICMTEIPYPEVQPREISDQPQGQQTPASRGQSELFHSGDEEEEKHKQADGTSRNSERAQRKKNRKHKKRTNKQNHNENSESEEEEESSEEDSSDSEESEDGASSASSSPARGPRMGAETAQVLRGTRSKKKQIQRLIALIEEKTASEQTQQREQLELRQEIAEFREKLKELDTVKRKLQVEVKRRGKLEVEYGVLKKIVENEKALQNHPDLLKHKDPPIGEFEQQEDGSMEIYEELKVYLRLYKDASARVQRLKEHERLRQEIDSEAIMKKFDSRMSADPAMNHMVDMNATFVEDDRKFLITVSRKIQKARKSPPHLREILTLEDFEGLTVGASAPKRKLLLDEDGGTRAGKLLPALKTRREKTGNILNFLCRDHGGILPPTLACDDCRKLLKPPMGVGSWP